MDEKIMVTDALNSINGGLTRFGEMISQTENQQLRQTLQQMRNETETCQYELFSIAKSKAYYQPAQQAQDEDIRYVKSIVGRTSMS